MAVLRAPLPHASYTALRNCWLRDPRISLKAKGLLGYLASHAEGYKISQAQMVRESKDGRDAVTSARDELEAAGYLVRIPQRSAGRFAEDDYALSDPFDSAGQLLPRGGRETRLSDAGDTRETRQSGLSDAGEPTREIRPLEDKGEKTTPVPSGQARAGSHLAAVPDAPPQPTPNQRADRLAKEHYEASGKLGGSRAFMGLRGIVSDAVDAGHPDEQIRAALAHLRSRGRTVTRAALGPLLTAGNGARSVGGGSYGPAQPYRNSPTPGAYEGPL